MALPSFTSLGARRRERRAEQEQSAVVDSTTAAETNSDRTLTPTYTPGINLKRATKNRKTWIGISCLFFLISTIFLILVCIGNINDKVVIRETYFIKIDLSNIIPASVGTSIQLVNSLARSLGLHDFYQVGMWNFCQGYNDEGITDCSTPKALYWFNPVEILLDQLLAGATIALPAEINDILSLVRIASNVMFGFFLAGCCMNFASIFLAPVTLYSRWWSLPFAIWTFIAALVSTAASVIITVVGIIFRNVITSQSELNIGGNVGYYFFAFMWVGSGFSIFGFVIHLCLTCCCASRRDVKTGRRMGSKKAYGDAAADEKKRPVKRRGIFRRKSEDEVV